MNTDREVRRDKRRRGVGKREVDLEGFELGPLPDLQPRIEEAERRVIEQHKKIVRERIHVRELEIRKDEAGAGNGESVVKPGRGRKKVGRKSRSIKIKYRRVPSNKVKLIHIDVIKMMAEDYLKNKIIRERLKQTGIRGKNMLKGYIERIDDYFSSLIDLRLSNSLIKSDLQKISVEKNKLRMKIFEVRKERNSVGLEMKSVREEFKKSKDTMNTDEKLYKQLLNLKNEGDVGEEKNAIEEIRHNLDCSFDKMKTLNLLQQINEILKKQN